MSHHIGFGVAIDATDCPVCGRAGTLIALDCADDCPGECCDRLCVDCGAALVDPVVTADVVRGVGPQAASRRRRSA